MDDNWDEVHGDWLDHFDCEIQADEYEDAWADEPEFEPDRHPTYSYR